MKGNKFLAAVLAASIAFSMAPVTAISTFAATPAITDADGKEVTSGAALTIGDVSGVYVGINAAGMQSILDGMDGGGSSITVSDDPTAKTNPSIEVGDDGNYTVNYGSVSGTFTKTSGGNTTTYNYTVDADKIKDAATGAGLARDLVKAYLTDNKVNANLASVTRAVTAFSSTTDTKYSTAKTTLNTNTNYNGSVAPNLKYTVAYTAATGNIDVTASVGGLTEVYSIPAVDVLPDDGSTIAASSYKIEDAKDNATLISEFEAAYSKDHTGITYTNPTVTSYTASQNGIAGAGKMTLKVTLKDAYDNKSTVTFQNITLEHGINIMKSDVEDAANKELKSIKKDAETALVLNGSKLSKDDLAKKIKTAMTAALSTHPYNDLIKTETDDYKKIAVDITDYTPATVSSEGSASGTIKFTYDYSLYMKDGSYATTTTDINPEYDDLSAYQSEVSFDFTLDKLDEVDATAIKQINSSRKYTNAKKESKTQDLYSNVSSVTLKSRNSVDSYSHELVSTEYGDLKQVTLTAVMRPSNANTYTINWSSADEKIATVAADKDDSAVAVLTGITEGKTTVKAELVDEDGKVLSTKTIKVKVNGFQFQDVQDTNQFYYDHVYNLYDDKLVAGTSVTTFSPKRTVTRAEFVQMLYAASGKTVTAESKFTDVADTAWYASAVTWAVDNNITAGTDKNTFSPNKTITRAEAMTMLYAAYGQGKTYNATHSFTDVKDNAYYKEAVNWAVKKGITAGTTGTTFGSNDPCNRGQAATFIDIARNIID